MNKENINKLIEFLEGDEIGDHFSMSKWIDRGDMKYDPDYPIERLSKDTILHTCGTVACIGGWTNLLFSEGIGEEYYNVHLAARYLGLSKINPFGDHVINSAADDMFYNYPRGRDFSAKDAATMLRRFLDTGEINWSGLGTLKPEPKMELDNDEYL